MSSCVRSLTVQLSDQVTGSTKALRTLYAACRDGTIQPQHSAILSIFDTLIEQLGACYIILDGLDECSDYQDLHAFVSHLLRLHERRLHFLATSRREREIEESLGSIVTAEIAVQACTVDVDIGIYVEAFLETDVRLRKWPPSVKAEILQTMVEKSNGMSVFHACNL
jgi:hypothetical protein